MAAGSLSEVGFLKQAAKVQNIEQETGADFEYLCSLAVVVVASHAGVFTCVARKVGTAQGTILPNGKVS